MQKVNTTKFRRRIFSNKAFSIKRVAILLLGFFFIVSAVSKLIVFKDFVFYIIEYLKLNSSFALFGASLIVSIELLIGGFLVLNYNIKYALCASISLLVVLSIFLIYLSIYFLSRCKLYVFW